MRAPIRTRCGQAYSWFARPSLLCPSSQFWATCAICIALACLFTSPASAQYGGGTGTAEDPYQIWTAEQMNQIGLHVEDFSKHFKLMADIDLGCYKGTEFNLISNWGSGRGSSFRGVFDGNGKVISHFTYDFSDSNDWYPTSAIGLFSCAYGAVLKDITLCEPNVITLNRHEIGALVGYTKESKISRCMVNGGTVQGGHRVGGMIGYSESDLVECSSSAQVIGDMSVGGLVGTVAGSMTSCSSTSCVQGGRTIGGLCGINYGYITRCYSQAEILTGEYSAAGIVGSNSGVIASCWAGANIQAHRSAGGFAALNQGEIEGCYSNGNVEGDVHMGGFVSSNAGSIFRCFWDVQASGLANMCGEGTEYCDDSFGRISAEMKQQATFEGWDFINVWGIGEGQTYPYLRTHSAGDIDHDGRVDFLDLAIIGRQWLDGAE